MHESRKKLIRAKEHTLFFFKFLSEKNIFGSIRLFAIIFSIFIFDIIKYYDMTQVQILASFETAEMHMKINKNLQ